MGIRLPPDCPAGRQHRAVDECEPVDAADEARRAAGVAKAVLHLKNHLFVNLCSFFLLFFSDHSIDQCEDKMRPYPFTPCIQLTSQILP